MAATATFLNNVLDLYFTNADHANIGDAAGLQNSATAGSFYISLHTADPVAGNQTTSEAAYTSYARQAVARSGAGFTVSGANCSNAATVTFPEATGGSETITHFGIGSDSTGNGNLFFSGALDSSLAVSTGVQPEFAAGDLDVDVS